MGGEEGGVDRGSEGGVVERGEGGRMGENVRREEEDGLVCILVVKYTSI